VHLGRSLAHVEATMRDADGRVVLTATATCHVRRAAGDAGAEVAA
jgi:acyl-coenzyme A thioesterase PaaI-like protein